MRLLIAALVLLSCPTARAGDVPTVREARRLLARPAGSLSLGLTNGGALVHGQEMPIEGRGYAFFEWVGPRRTNFGTREMVRLLRGAARAVAGRFRGSVMGLGNISKKEGGPCGESVSHQSGRDVDVGLFALDRRGRPVNLRAFVYFGEDGWDAHRRFQFDDRRNLALALALLADREAQVQWIFVAEWLKRRIVARAYQEDVPEETVARLLDVLHQPADSNPHADHFHVRIYCSVQDRLHGCLERGPIRPFARLGDEAFEERVGLLAGLLGMKQARWRQGALDALGAIRAAGALPAIHAALRDPDPGARRAALRAVRSIRDPSSFGPAGTELRRTGDPDWARALFEAIALLESPEAAALAAQMLRAPQRVLTPSARRALWPILERAIDVVGWHGRKDAAPLLLRHLDSDAPSVRRAAHAALRRLTNQPVVRDRAETSGAAREWRELVRRHAGDPWLEWVRLGFERRGHAVGRGPLGWASVETLVGLLRDPDADCAVNASRALSEITGYEVDPRHRTRRNTQRLWRAWLGAYREHTGPEPEVRSARRNRE